MLVFLFQIGYAQTTVSYTTAGTHSFQVPPGVTQITVEAWGAGGGAATPGGPNNHASGGGGGGAYAAATILVTPTFSFDVIVGAGGSIENPGGDSYFDDGSLLLAKGGEESNGDGGSGGLASASVGTTKYDGGDGGDRQNQNTAGGGGGGSAFSNANGGDGGDGSSGIGGTAGSGEGNGGTGGNTGAPGVNGSLPGGGGGGRGQGNVSSGSGADGMVRITYTLPIITYDLAIHIVGLGGVGVATPTSTICSPASSPCLYNIEENTVVELTALESFNGWSFDGWSGDPVTGIGSVVTLTMDAAKVITATFTQDQYNLTEGVNLFIEPVGAGSVDINPPGPYVYGDVITLTASPGAQFLNWDWEGDLYEGIMPYGMSPNNPLVITILGPVTITAFFSLMAVPLSNWALMIGIALIVIFMAFRLRNLF